MIELSQTAAQAVPGIAALLITAVAAIYYRQAKRRVDRQRAERGDRVGMESRGA